MSASLALVNILLTPNFRCNLPFLIMLLMLQGIHPEIIFNLIPYVTISRQQHEAIMMAWTLLRKFSFILLRIRNPKLDSFLSWRKLFRECQQNRVSIFFANFQTSLLRKTFERCGFAGHLPSLEIVQKLAQNLAIVRMNPLPPIFPITQLFLSTGKNLLLLKIALEMQEMISHVRSSYPEIISVLTQNEKALMNIIMVWNNQVIVKQVLYGVSFNRHGSLFNILEDIKMNQLFAFLILAVIDPDFIDQSLTQIIANCGNRNVPFQNIEKYLQFLKDHCQSIAPMIFGHFLDIGQVLDCFSSMETSMTRTFQVRYMLRPWRMAFGRIVPSDRPEYEEVTIEQGSWVPIFDVFSTFWQAFFLNFSRTFAQSFLPFGNLAWSEGYTRLIQVEFDWIIRIVIGNFAFRIGALDDHAFFKSNTQEYMHTDITSTSYGMFIFPDGIRNSKISREICSCFLRYFWRVHQRPYPNMSDIDYIRWLFSIPGTFAVLGKSSIDLIDALQNGTELPEILDGSSGDFTYLSFPTVPTDPEVQQDYYRIFRAHFEQLGREPKITDFDEPRE